MADAMLTGGPSRGSVLLFTIAVILIHAIDFLFVRRSGVVSYTTVITLAVVYTFLAFLTQGIFKDKSPEPFIWFGAMWLMPFVVSWLIRIVGATSGMGKAISVLVVFYPLFIFYLIRKNQLTGLVILYILLWMFGYLFTHVGDIQTYAGQQGIEMPYNPVLSYEYLLDWTWEKLKQLAGVPGKAYQAIEQEITRSIRAAKGDYYTGTVDAAAQKRLGVYLENFRTSEPFFYEDIPVTAYATMKAETLDRELTIQVTCEADDMIDANKILPMDAFSVMATDQFDIDCIWNKGVLKKGLHDLKLTAEFDFITRAYLKHYVMNRDRLREYRRQNIDPLAGVPDKSPTAIYTSGPLRIGMGLGQQPVALGQRGEAFPSLGITLENAWEGKVLQVTDVFIYLPEGLTISTTEGIGLVSTTCADVPDEEQPACDDSLVNVYKLTPEELALPIYREFTIKNMRIYLKIADPDRILGKAPIAVQNIKTSVQYRYLLERTTSASVREPAAEASP